MGLLRRQGWDQDKREILVSCPCLFFLKDKKLSQIVKKIIKTMLHTKEKRFVWYSCVYRLLVVVKESWSQTGSWEDISRDTMTKGIEFCGGTNRMRWEMQNSWYYIGMKRKGENHKRLDLSLTSTILSMMILVQKSSRDGKQRLTTQAWRQERQEKWDKGRKKLIPIGCREEQGKHKNWEIKCRISVE